MAIELVEVELHPIPKFNVLTAEGKIRLQKIVSQGENHDFFLIQIEKKTLESGKVPFYYLTPIPTYSNEKQNNRLRVYKVVFQKERIHRGKKTVVVYGQVEKAVNL